MEADEQLESSEFENEESVPNRRLFRFGHVFVSLIALLVAIYFYRNRSRSTNSTAPEAKTVPTLTAEELRRRRLDRLQNQPEQPSTPPSDPPSRQTDAPNPPQPKDPKESLRRRPVSDPQTEKPHGSPQTEPKKSATEATTENTTQSEKAPKLVPVNSPPPAEAPQPTAATTPIPSPAPSPSVAAAVSTSSPTPVAQPRKKSEEEIEADLLTEVFQLTSQPGIPNTYLVQLADRLSRSNLDEALLGRLEAFPNGVTAYQYLIGCYKRAEALARLRPALAPLILHARTTAVTYTGLVVQDSLSVCQPGVSHIPLFYNSIRNEEIDLEFLNIFGHQYESEGLDGIVAALAGPAAQILRGANAVYVKKEDFNVMLALSASPAFAHLFVALPTFIPTRDPNGGLQFELLSLLGSIFRPTTLAGPASTAGQLIMQLFPGREMLQTQVHESFAIIRKANLVLHSTETTILQNLLRNKDTKDSVLDWIGVVIQTNRNRAKLRVDQKTISSDGFLINLSAALLRLCEPFLGNEEKLKLLNPDYVLASPRADISYETSLSATTDQFKSAQAAVAPGQSYSFVTECFYLTYYTLHLGLSRFLESFFHLLRELHRLQRRRHELSQARSTWEGTPAGPQMQRMLDQVNAEFDTLFKIQLTGDAVLRDEALVTRLLDFYLFAARWLTTEADPSGAGPVLNSPLPLRLAVCPEFFVMDILEYLLFLTRYTSESLSLIGPRMHQLVQFLVLFLGSNLFITNPYVRSKLVELLHEMSKSSAVSPDLWKHPSLVQSLSSALFRLYVDIESTGRHAQFYEKFGVRQQITLLLKHLRSLPAYTESIRKLADDVPFFTAFMNVLLNDSTFLLDEIFTSLEKIKETEDAMAELDAWLALAPEVRQEKEEQLGTQQGQAKSFCELANESLLLLHYLTETMIEPFKAPAIMERLATQLNFFLGKLASAQGRRVNVKNPERFHFDPKFLIKTISEIYTHYVEPSEFPYWMAKDERTFQASPETFDNAIDILSRHELVSAATLARLKALIAKAKDALLQSKEEELDLDEAPDEFLDPLTAALMQEPVTLPTSNQVVDRSTIVRHLLNTPTDPFNRAPLHIDQVLPNPELQKRVADWLAEKKQK